MLEEESTFLNVEMNPQFEKAYRLMQGAQNLFITGKAGTGKSTLLNFFVAIAIKNQSYWHRREWRR